MHEMPRMDTSTTSSVLRLLVIHHTCDMCVRTKSTMTARRSEKFHENSNTTLTAKSSHCVKCPRKNCDEISPHVRGNEGLVITHYSLHGLCGGSEVPLKCSIFIDLSFRQVSGAFKKRDQLVAANFVSIYVFSGNFEVSAFRVLYFWIQFY